jgi:cytochrome c553
MGNPLVVMALLVATVAAVPPARGADAALGRQKAAACVACHGEFGISVLPNAPHLAGQPEIYLAEQLRLYRSGKRGNEVMAVIAKPLSDADIDALAAWFAAIEVQAKPPK